jgi:hypothetical protein
VTPRNVLRAKWPSEIRIEQLETDADEFDQGMGKLAGELKGIRTILLGLLISITTASVGLMLNVLFSVHK